MKNLMLCNFDEFTQCHVCELLLLLFYYITYRLQVEWESSKFN